MRALAKLPQDIWKPGDYNVFGQGDERLTEYAVR
jgi:hypothetical protein